MKSALLVALLAAASVADAYSVVTNVADAVADDQQDGEVVVEHSDYEQDDSPTDDYPMYEGASTAEEAGSARAMAAFEEADKQAFVDMINGLLWDRDFEESYDDMDETARQMGEHPHHFRKRGLLRRPMPEMLRDDSTIAGQFYRSFTDQCYALTCRLGLQGLASSLDSLFSLGK